MEEHLHVEFTLDPKIFTARQDSPVLGQLDIEEHLRVEFT